MTDLPLAALEVELDAALSHELRERSRALEGLGSVWVTDLLDPRTAYFRARVPQPIPPERLEAIAHGRDRHEAFERAAAEVAFREVRVFREGIVGVIDVFEEMPTEVKTSSSFPGASELAAQRPAYLEQVAMYCALADRPEGRLVLLRPEPSGADLLVAYRLRVVDVARVRGEMGRRRDALRSAFAHDDPSGLPACRWFGRGCEYRATSACPCTGSERLLDPAILDAIGAIETDPEESARLNARLGAVPDPGDRSPAVPRFTNLLFPRRAYFRARASTDEEGPAAPGRAGSDDLYRHLVAVLDSGAPGESTREAPQVPWVRERVGLFRGEPVLLKVTRARSIPAATELRSRQPHYFVDLALRCAAARRDSGWLVLGSERASSVEERVRAIHVRVPLRPAWEAIGGQRARDLERALHGDSDPLELPACPGWMFESCPYRDRCRCGGPPEGITAAANGR